MELVVVVDSYGLMSLALRQEPAAVVLDLGAGSGITLRRSVQ
jgi:hypothetical protein